MKINVVVHEAEEGGYWAEVPDIQGCATQGETFQELLHNLHEAVEACLSVDVLTDYKEPVVFVIKGSPTNTSPEFLHLIQAARQEIERGAFISLEEMKRDLADKA